MSTMSPNEIRTPTSVSWQEGDILRTTILPGVEQTLADAQETAKVVLALAAGRRPPLLVDLRRMKSQDRDARQYFGSPEVVQEARAIGLLVESRLSMLIANFFIAVTKTSVPTKIFTEEAAALAWLKGFVA